MEIRICDICKIRPQIPDGVCISCAYSNEHSRRLVLEQHLFLLLDLTRGVVNQIEAAVAMVQSGQIDPLELSKALERVKLLPPGKTE